MVPAISKSRSCCSTRASITWPWRSPTRGYCCASGAFRCPSWLLNADADSFDQMIANPPRTRDIQPPFARRLRRGRGACGREPLPDPYQARHGYAPAGIHGRRSRGAVQGAGGNPAGQGRLGLLAPQLCRHARRGCLYPGADRPVRPHECPRRRLAALPGHPPYGQFGRHRTLPRGTVRHVPPRAGALRLRLPA